MMKLVIAICLIVSASAGFAAVGDMYNPYNDYNLDDPTPWSYLCQEGTGVWDGTYNFTPMVVMTSGTSGRVMWSAPHSADYYGFQCGVFDYYSNLAVNTYKKKTDDSRTYGIGIVGFTAPEGGDYEIKGQASTYQNCSGTAWINKQGPGMLWSAPVVGGQGASTFDFTINLAAGNTVYWGSTLTTGNDVYGLWEAQPIYWHFTITQISDKVVPEPGSLFALCSGLLGLGGIAIRRRK